MSDAMNIKLTVADFEEMDANTLLGLHNKILESRDELADMLQTVRDNYSVACDRGDRAVVAFNKAERHLNTARHALAEYAIRAVLEFDDEL